jgi:hypothetical protein
MRASVLEKFGLAFRLPTRRHKRLPNTWQPAVFMQSHPACSVSMRFVQHIA